MKPKHQTLADFIEREAGQVLVGFALIFLGAALYRWGVPKIEDLIPFGLGVISRSMGTAAVGVTRKALVQSGVLPPPKEPQP